jgi:CBS domain-containing protein
MTRSHESVSYLVEELVRVGDIASRPLLCADPEEPLADIAGRMDDFGLDAMPLAETRLGDIVLRWSARAA